MQFPSMILQPLQSRFTPRTKRHISHLPWEVLQECLSYLPFVCDKFTEIHHCRDEYRIPRNHDEFLMNLLEFNGYNFGRGRSLRASEDRLSPGNRPGVDVVHPLEAARWQTPSLPRACRRDCRVEYWNWLDVRRVCVAWKHAADGSPAFNTRVALQSKQTAQRSLALSLNMPLYVHVVMESSRWRAKSFRQFFFQMLENNMHRIAEIVIVAEPHAFSMLWNGIKQRRLLVRPAPLLERFEINSLDDVQSGSLHIEHPHLFPVDNVPRLRHVFIHGYHIQRTCSVFSPSLVSLVVQGSGVEWPTYTEMTNTLSSMRGLEVLSLCFNRYEEPQITAAAEQAAPVDLPHLKTLKLEARPSLLAFFVAHATFPTTTETHLGCLVEKDDDVELLQSAGGDYYRRLLDQSCARYQDITYHRDHDERHATLVFSRPCKSDGSECDSLPALVSAKAIFREDGIYKCTEFLHATRLAFSCSPSRMRIVVTQSAGSVTSHRDADERLWGICIGDTSAVTEVRLGNDAGREFVRRLIDGGLPSKYPSLRQVVFSGLKLNGTKRSGLRDSFIGDLGAALERMRRGLSLNMEDCAITPRDEVHLRMAAARRLIHVRLLEGGQEYSPSLRRALPYLHLFLPLAIQVAVGVSSAYIFSWIIGGWLDAYEVGLVCWLGYVSWTSRSWLGLLIPIMAGGCALYLNKI